MKYSCIALTFDGNVGYKLNKQVACWEVLKGTLCSKEGKVLCLLFQMINVLWKQVDFPSARENKEPVSNVLCRLKWDRPKTLRQTTLQHLWTHAFCVFCCRSESRRLDPKHLSELLSKSLILVKIGSSPRSVILVRNLTKFAWCS